ncbi:hypothetical protein LWI29_020851 [Acer saccharum]|uniref:CTLH domain-containing protein n=1 Tax=Acer saccharum TaxID=4024 RepID=A0AA39RDL2_ACESA|nr:hypothetical protein LWI29_020851 [Acer saccharum]
MRVDEDMYKHLVILIMKFLEEENCKESLHQLEQESKIFFNMKRFGENIINGEFEKAEKYLSAFTKLDDNEHSRELFAELRKLKYDEALLREIPSARAKLHDDLKILVRRNPILQDKLVFPFVIESALSSLVSLVCPCSEKKNRSRKEELIYLILQFLDEEEFKETLHKLEVETKVFFNMNYFEEYMINGQWYEAEKYLSAFTKMDDNKYSVELFSEMQKQKSHEAVDRQKKCPSVYTERTHFCDAMKLLIEQNPILKDKIKFPSIDKSRLFTLIKQTMDWWVPYYASVMPNGNNQTFSLRDIPTTPYLFHDPSFVNDSSQEGGFLSVPSGHGSNDSSCVTDVNKSTESTSLADANDLVCMKPVKNFVSWKLQQINEPSECRSLVLHDNSMGGRVVRLIYSDAGDFIVALAQNATHKLWTWKRNQQSLGKANADVQPHLYQPSSGKIMTNEIGADPENSVPCFALKGSHLFSGSGGKISIFSLETFETLATFANPPPTATYFIFLPQDLFAIGFDDCSIIIHCPYTKKTRAKLKGHQNRITRLAFSHSLNVLVSSGADAKLCVWDANEWENICSKFLQNLHTGVVPETPVVSHIQFHPDQIHLLVVHEWQIDVFEAPTLNLVTQLVLDESDLPITCATYSCDGKSIYVGCKSGCIKVFDATSLNLRCQINLTAYAQPTNSLELYPLVIATHPSQPNQIALGLNNGRVHVLEPLQSQVEWGTLPPPRDS